MRTSIVVFRVYPKSSWLIASGYWGDNKKVRLSRSDAIANGDGNFPEEKIVRLPRRLCIRTGPTTKRITKKDKYVRKEMRIGKGYFYQMYV